MTLTAVATKQLLQPRLEVTGGRRLSGEIRVSGAKNSALVLMAACLLTRETLRLRNVPMLSDIAAMGEILAALGVRVTVVDRRPRLQHPPPHPQPAASFPFTSTQLIQHTHWQRSNESKCAKT